MKKIVKTIIYKLLSCYYYGMEILFPSKIKLGKDIPILINNFNRLTSLLLLVDALKSRGYDNIHIIDNNSTYPPLLEYYSICPYNVIQLKDNLGFKALWKSHLKKIYCSDYYIYTDSDVVPAKHCPPDFIDFLFVQMKNHPFAYKIGLSLRIDNIPNHYREKEKVISWEKRFYSQPVTEYLYRAPIDTTFALYRPRVGLSRSRYKEVYRTAYPYEAEHLPWYINSEDLPEEESYYINHCKQTTEWTSLLIKNVKE